MYSFRNLAGPGKRRRDHGSVTERLYQAGDYDGAIRSVRKILRVDPLNWRAVNSMAQIYGAKGDYVLAIKHARNAKNYAPDAFEPRDVLIKCLFYLGHGDAALAELVEAEAQFPNEPEVHVRLGHYHLKRGETEAAIVRFKRALALSGGFHPILGDLIFLKRSIFDWSHYEADDRTARELVRAGHALQPLTVISLHTDSQEQLDACALWSRRFARAPNEQLAPRAPTRNARQRIGYLSGDFYSHAISHLIAELLEKHDREAFEIIGFSHGPEDDSAVRRRLVAGFDSFVRLNDLSDRAAAEEIARRNVDILVDLTGYTQNARTGILGYRPASIQVNYLGFPGSMGAEFIDYVIADEHVAPMKFQRFCTEKIVQLPGCFQPNDSRRDIDPEPVHRTDHGLPEQAFVFCCFNTPYKIGPTALETWKAILDSVPRSVLWLLAPCELARRNLLAEAQARGIAAERLIFRDPGSQRAPLGAAASCRPESRHPAGWGLYHCQRRPLGWGPDFDPSG